MPTLERSRLALAGFAGSLGRDDKYFLDKGAMPPRLSAAEIEKLRALYEDSPLSVTEIALAAGHDASAIYSYARRRGWKPRAARRAPRLPHGEIRALYEDSLVPVHEIGRIAGVADRTIYGYAAAGGWKPRASRLRTQSLASDEVVDVAAEVAAARRRAEQEQRLRTARMSERNAQELLRWARAEVQLQRARERERQRVRARLD